MSSLERVGDEAFRILRETVNGVAFPKQNNLATKSWLMHHCTFPPYWMHESNHVNAFVNSLDGTRLEVIGQELGGPGARADIAAEFVTDGCS